MYNLTISNACKIGIYLDNFIHLWCVVRHSSVRTCIIKAKIFISWICCSLLCSGTMNNYDEIDILNYILTAATLWDKPVPYIGELLQNNVTFLHLVGGCHGCLCNIHVLYAFCWWIGDAFCICFPCDWLWRGTIMWFLKPLWNIWINKFEVISLVMIANENMPKLSTTFNMRSRVKFDIYYIYSDTGYIKLLEVAHAIH